MPEKPVAVTPTVEPEESWHHPDPVVHLVLPKLCEAAFGKGAEAWLPRQWMQFIVMVLLGIFVTGYGGNLVRHLTDQSEPHHMQEVLMPWATSVFGGGLGFISGVCAMGAASAAAQAKPKK